MSPRIVSLLPAATEIVCALGAGDSLVGVSHECDYPPDVADLPRVTLSPIDQDWSGAAIDAEVRRLREAGRPVIAVDGRKLEALAPDLILTQDLCQVCAVADGEVFRLATAMTSQPRMLTLTGRDLAGIWEDIFRIGEAIGQNGEAAALVARLTRRLSSIPVDRMARRPSIVCIEWLDPLYLAGHWVPQLIEAAGGRDVGAAPGSHSVVTTWERVEAARPDIIIVALCGFSPGRAFKEIGSLADNHWLLHTPAPVWVLDGNAFTSRPGPRVVEGAQLVHSAMCGEERPGLLRFCRSVEPQMTQITQIHT